MPIYDYIIIGAGASGLLLADALGSDVFFGQKKILLIDKSDKTKNDRTWCFWERNKGRFDGILLKTWENIQFAGKDLSISPKIAPYSYKMLTGIDFYGEFVKRVDNYSNVTFAQDEVVKINEVEDSITVIGKIQVYHAKMVFDSRFDYQILLAQSKYPVLQQHFLGWFVKTEKPVFDAGTATFMDFSILQKGNTRFMYVLPLSENEGLVEYTLFSEKVLEKEEYENAIKHYLTTVLQAEKYEITEVEQGNIPMTCYDFTKENTSKTLKIGIAGGWAKASTGYTFYNSTKQVSRFINHLKMERPLHKFPKKTRFWFYDLLFLDVLYQNNHLGSKVFEAMFRKCPPQLILKFLDEDTNFFEEFKIIWACPKWPFTKALFRRILSFNI